MSKLTDDFIEWVLSEYGIHLTAKPNPDGDSFEKIFPDLYFLLKENNDDNNTQ